MAQDLRSQFTHNVIQSVVSPDDLRNAAQAAQTHQLLLSAVHVTGDLTLLDRYEDRVGRPAGMGFGGTGTEAVAEEAGVREELLELLTERLSQESQPEYLRVEDPSVFARMSNIAAGYPVSEAQVAMNMVQGGFVPDQRAVTPSRAPSKTLNLAIVGAGMTGIDAAVKATERGFEWEIFEMSSGPGGLWWSQKYPGVAVDTPSMYYSLSWEITPNWSKYFPTGSEYRSYLLDIVDKYQLRDRMRFNTEVTRMEWLEEEQVWELTLVSAGHAAPTIVHAAAVLTAAGHLNRPKYPDVPGLGEFNGESIHTATWRDVDLEGKRVGVVGVGAAGVQVVSAIAPLVSELSVFQRQPVWLSANSLGDGLVTDSERWLRKNLPYYSQWSRLAIFAQVNAFAPLMNEVDVEWMKSNPTSISQVNEMARQGCLKYINDTFGEDSELARKVTPDFPFAGKRPVRDPGDFRAGGYYWALAQPHTQLVTDGLARVVPDGIVTADGVLHELDVIIWATGMTLDFLSPVEIIGREGLTLREAWEDYMHPRAYFGGMVPGFPNLFINDGPHTGVANGGAGHNFMTETVNHFIFEALQLMVENEACTIEVSNAAYDEHTASLEARMSKLIWMHDDKANTYYRNAAGYVILPSPFLAEEYWERSQRPIESAFHLEKANVANEAVAS